MINSDSLFEAPIIFVGLTALSTKQNDVIKFANFAALQIVFVEYTLFNKP